MYEDLLKNSITKDGFPYFFYKAALKVVYEFIII